MAAWCCPFCSSTNLATVWLPALLLGVIAQEACFDLGDEGDRLGAILNKAAVEMLSDHEQQRTVVYRPRRGAFQHYQIQIGAHYPCRTVPCDAPFGHYQGGVLVQVERGTSGTGYFNNFIAVSQPLMIPKRNTDAKILLINRGWYIEITNIS